MSANKKTLVTLLLDRSGSMQSQKSDTLGAINAYIEELQKSEGDLRFSLVQFDYAQSGMQLDTTFEATKIKEVGFLSSDDFRPRGTTPLLDAIFTTIQAVDEQVGERDDINVVIAIQTDGMENASREASWASVKSLINEKEAKGWEFNFMGAGLDADAYGQSERLGIKREKTISYGLEGEATRAAFSAAAMNTSLYATGSVADLSFSAEQKVAAGDHADAEN